MKGVVLLKVFSFSSGLQSRQDPPGSDRPLMLLDTVAFSVFFMYLFTLTASINVYAYFCSFLAGAPLISI